MDALCVCKNDILQLAAELVPSAGVSFSLHWYGNAEQQGMPMDVTRSDDFGIHRWNTLWFFVGDKISVITTGVDKIDDPAESLTAEQQETLQKSKPKMKPGKRVRARFREIGELDCQINNKPLFSFKLTTNNMMSVNFVWLGDKTGRRVMHVSLGGASTKPRIPKMKFGDEVTFRITECH